MICSKIYPDTLIDSYRTAMRGRAGAARLPS